nr:zinc finger, PMZ-type [Tanacetum cinerariifolium]
MNIGLRPVCNDEQLNYFVQALFKNDCHLDMYIEHQGYDVLERINDDRHYEEKSDSDFKDVEKDDLWLNKLVGKGRFVGELEDPILGLKGMKYKSPSQLKQCLANCGVTHGYQLWYMQNDTYKLLVKCGRDVSAGKCAGKWSVRGSSDKGKGKLGEERSEPSKVSQATKERWRKNKLEEKKNLKNAGLSKAVKIWLSDAEHRQYTRHIYLVDRDPNTWCRAYFELDKSCAAFENGISESFNSKILSARGKPIITMLEDIIIYIMQRVWFVNKTAMELNDSIILFARRHLEFMKIRQRKCMVYASRFPEVEVRRQDEAFGVNIHLKKCACKICELIGLPCMHAVAGCTYLKKDPELVVTKWFSKNKWFESFQYSIRPEPGTKLWKNSDLPKPLPPGERKLPGRLRKRRIRHPSEYDHEISRVGRVMHCHRCWESGHNKSKCTNAPKPKPDNFYEIHANKERQNGSNAEMERDQYQQVGPSVDEIPKYIEDPVMPTSSSGNKRKEPLVKKKSSQVNEACGSKSNLTPEEHAEMMDKEAFTNMVRTDAENKAKKEEIIGIMLSVDDEHIIGNKEPVNPTEQTHVISSASGAPVDQFPKTSQYLSIEKAASSAPVDQFLETPQDPKKKANKRKKKADSEHLLGSTTKTEGDQKGLQSSRLKSLNLMQMAYDLLLRKLLMSVIDCFRMNVNLGDDDLPSPDNKDKDFDPPFYEHLVFKEVPNSMRLLPFLAKNEEKVFKPGI